MSRNLNIFSKCILGCGLALATLVPLRTAHARGFSVLYSFNGSDGAYPTAGLIGDGAGNLYGTTGAGGADNDGVVFKLAPDGTETVLYFFTGGSDGSAPYAGLIMDKTGNLYSTTYGGGGSTNCSNGCGTVFKLAPNGTETGLYSFTGGRDGSGPRAGLIMDKKGNLYSTTFEGGANGAGVVFKLAPDGTETALYSFTGESDGAYPYASLIMDKKGNLYGTTYDGGITGCGGHGCGVVFRLAPNGTETVLYSFTGGSDGRGPFAGLITDGSGNIYGTTGYGGGTGCNGPGCGTVFKLAPNGTETLLHIFTGGSDGGYPYAGLIVDKKGSLYSTTSIGGPDNRGVVFKLAPGGTETVLYLLHRGGSGGGHPIAGLIMDKKGNLYSTTVKGGADKHGVVFRLKE